MTYVDKQIARHERHIGRKLRDFERPQLWFFRRFEPGGFVWCALPRPGRLCGLELLNVSRRSCFVGGERNWFWKVRVGRFERSWFVKASA